jgi:histidyl-tRNA synthetase
MAKLTTQPYKGARDFYPEDMRLQRYIYKVWREISERYGYEEYDAPMLELTDLYRAKTGEEIVNEQTYSFTDRGGRDVTIRPEMTPSLARMVAARQQELAFPLRWYSIPNLWRYERPQHGRLREHWQLNVDIFGVGSIAAEFEVIKVADSIMRAFGASEDMYTIKINSRQLLSQLMGDYLKLDVMRAHKLSKLLDRKDKLSEVAFNLQAEEIVGDEMIRLKELLTIDSIDALPTVVVESGLAENLRQLIADLEEYGVNNVKFDLTLMRGFDYYTGTVFEFFDTSPNNPRAILGGGRYDELTGIFGQVNVPAVGFAAGDVTLADFLNTHQLTPSLSSATDVYVAVIGNNEKTARKLAASLRQAGVNAAIDYTGRKAAAQIKTALKQKIPYVIFVGDEEAKTAKYTLKNLKTEKEQKAGVNELVTLLQS